MEPKHRGQPFADFLDELGIREDVEAQARKEILTEEIRVAVENENLSKTARTDDRSGRLWAKPG